MYADVVPEVYLYNVNYTNGTSYDPDLAWVTDDNAYVRYVLPTGVYELHIFTWILNY